MIGEFTLALVAGLVTILNPCVLPLVPILVASSLGKHRFGPIALSIGIGVSFTVFGFTIIAFGFQLGINEQSVRMFAGWMLVVAGALLFFPKAQSALSGILAPLTRGANATANKVSGNGLSGQFTIGLLLGLVWAPCVGPTLGAAIAAASMGGDLLYAFLTFLVFALGVGISISLFAYASRKIVGPKSELLRGLARFAKPIFGSILVLVGLMIVTGIDKIVEAWILRVMPHWWVAFTTSF